MVGQGDTIPFPQGELQTSYARVRSPENARGGGEDQRKQSASIRLEDAQHSGYAIVGVGAYLGLCWIDPHFFVHFSACGNVGALRCCERRAQIRANGASGRSEAHQRIQDSVPATDLSIAGRRAGRSSPRALAALVPVRRAIHCRALCRSRASSLHSDSQPSGFDPAQFYGSDRIWSFSVGATLTSG